MKQTEKNKKSRTLILSQAFLEFAEHGYAAGSMNSICAGGKISKGLLYHYYPNKDALYLACIEKCFDEMTAYLRDRIDLSGFTIKEYFDMRLSFFRSNPQHQKLFFDAVMYPQPHLNCEIQRRRTEFNNLNHRLLSAILQKETLADHITIEEAVLQLDSFVDFFGVQMRMESDQELERHAMALLQTMLYGIIARV